MANIKTQQRIDVDLSLDSQEAQDLLTHLEATTNEQSNNNVLAIVNSLSNAIKPKVRKERDPNAPKPGRKPKAAASEPAAPVTTTAPSAPAAPVNGSAPATKPAATPAPKQKVAATV